MSDSSFAFLLALLSGFICLCLNQPFVNPVLSVANFALARITNCNNVLKWMMNYPISWIKLSNLNNILLQSFAENLAISFETHNYTAIILAACL
jgi:hypothetical protein